MQIIFQDPYASLNPRIRGRDPGEPLNVHEIGDPPCARPACGTAGSRRPAARARQRYPTSSPAASASASASPRAGGQSDLIVCDEPVSALDVSIQAQIVNLLQDLQRASASATCSSPTTSPW